MEFQILLLKKPARKLTKKENIQSFPDNYPKVFARSKKTKRKWNVCQTNIIIPL